MFESEILIATLVLANVTLCRCIIISTPSNTVLVVGQRMEMECLTTSGSIVREWKRERHLVKGIDDLFLNWDTGPRDTNSQFPQFGVDVDGSGSGFLYSNFTEIEDAGIYSCVVQDNAELLQYSAQLTVLESTPSCETNLTAGENALITNIWIQCSVCFNGGWWPLVEWKHHDGNQVRRGQILSDGVSTVTFNNSTTISTLTAAVNSTKGVFSVSFKMYFSRPSDRTSVSATNTPSYEYTWIESFGVESSEGVQSTGLSMRSGVVRTNTPTIDSFAEVNSVHENGKYSLLLWLVASMATVIAVMAITAIVCFFRFRNSKAKSRLGVTSESHGNLESLQHSDHPLHAISDHYDTIEELNIVDESTARSPIFFLPQRTGLLPTPGYSGLQSVEQILPPSVYCRMNAEEPVEMESELEKKSVLTKFEDLSLREETESCLVKGDLLKEDHETIPNKEDEDSSLTPMDDIEDTRSAVVDPSYLELFE